MQNKNSEQIVKKYFEEDLTLFNDKLFNKAILKKEFVEELLQVIFGLGLTTYHIERCIKENGSFVNNGYHEIYINAENDDKSEIAEVMKMMSTKTM